MSMIYSTVWLTSIFILLDISAAFNTIDYNILLQRFTTFIGLSDTIYSWLCSYILGHFEPVYSGDAHSKHICLGVPRDSVLSSFSFRIYPLPFSLLLLRLCLSFYFYAGDTQIYISFSLFFDTVGIIILSIVLL